jgi:hypothetical protein
MYASISSSRSSIYLQQGGKKLTRLRQFVAVNEQVAHGDQVVHSTLAARVSYGLTRSLTTTDTQHPIYSHHMFVHITKLEIYHYFNYVRVYLVRSEPDEMILNNLKLLQFYLPRLSAQRCNSLCGTAGLGARSVGRSITVCAHVACGYFAGAGARCGESRLSYLGGGGRRGRQMVVVSHFDSVAAKRTTTSSSGTSTTG